MAQRNVSFLECDVGSYLITDQYISGSRCYGYEDS